MFNMEIRKSSVLTTMLLTFTFILMLINFIFAHEIYAGTQTLNGEELLSRHSINERQEGEHRHIAGAVELDTGYSAPFFKVDGVVLLNEDGSAYKIEPKDFESKENEKRLKDYWEDGSLQSSTSMEFAEKFKGKTVEVTGTHKAYNTGSKPDMMDDGGWVSNQMLIEFSGIVVETIEILDVKNLPGNIDRSEVENLPGNIDRSEVKNLPGNIDLSEVKNLPGNIDLSDDENLPENPGRDLGKLPVESGISDGGSHSEEVPVEKDEDIDIGDFELNVIENVIDEPPLLTEKPGTGQIGDFELKVIDNTFEDDYHQALNGETDEELLTEIGGNSQMDESSGSNSSSSGIMAVLMTFISAILALFRFNS